MHSDRVPRAFHFLLLISLAASACTGGQETAAGETAGPARQPSSTSTPPPSTRDVRKEIGAISPSVPIYAGAHYNDELSRRDLVAIQNQYGREAQVFTLATEDSFPQVWHYYVTYLAQYRAFTPPNPYPPEGRTARTLQIYLNQAMQDPFIPGGALISQRQLTLQLVETDSRPRTLIRYILTAQPLPTSVAIQ